MESCDVLVIGAGPAGLAAAIGAREAGAGHVVVLDRNPEAGGILYQCVHPGFGLQIFKEELTGPEYAERFVTKAAELGIDVRTESMVLELRPDRTAWVASEKAYYAIRGSAVVLAMGCRERARGALGIPGTRPAGIFTAGAAQKLVNLDGRLPGERVVIVGSGDIGLIMARRLTLEGAKVQAVVEIMPYYGGLTRNIVQCLEDFEIPLYLSHSVTAVEGVDRVSGVTIAEIDAARSPIPGTEKHIDCDTVLLSAGLIPENELSLQVGVALNPITNGPLVDEHMETSVPGFFAGGNVVHVHDLVDNVTREATAAGRGAAQYARAALAACAGAMCSGSRLAPPLDVAAGSVEVEYPDRLLGGRRASIPVEAGEGVRYIVPNRLDGADLGATTVPLLMRVTKPMDAAKVTIYDGSRPLLTYRKQYLRPSEMLAIALPAKLAAALSDGSTVRVEVTEVAPDPLEVE